MDCPFCGDKGPETMMNEDDEANCQIGLCNVCAGLYIKFPDEPARAPSRKEMKQIAAAPFYKTQIRPMQVAALARIAHTRALKN